jgi:hypothetical protein
VPVVKGITTIEQIASLVVNLTATVTMFCLCVCVFVCTCVCVSVVKDLTATITKCIFC